MSESIGNRGTPLSDHNTILNTHNLTTDINHDTLLNYEAVEHIDWTNTSSNLKTVGTGEFENIGINTDVDDANIGIELFKEIGSGNYGSGIKSRCVMDGDDTEFYGIWNDIDFPLAGKEYGFMTGIRNNLDGEQDGVTIVGIDNIINNSAADGRTYGIRQIFGSGSDGATLAPIYQEFNAQGSSQDVYGLHNVGIAGNESNIIGVKNDFEINAYAGSGIGVRNTFSVRSDDDEAFGTYNYIYGHSLAGDYISLYGAFNRVFPNKTDMQAYGTYTQSYLNIFTYPTINDPEEFQVADFVDWKILGTDANMKKWTYYNTQVSNLSGKRFLGKDDIKQYLGTGYDASFYYDGTNLVFNPQETGSGGVEILNVKSGATQSASGAGADEIWKTASHATLPDNVLMIGV